MRELKLHSGQQKVMDSDKRFLGVITGAQGGKTTLGAIWLCNEVYKAYEQQKAADFKLEPFDFLIAAPTLDILRASTLVKFREIFPKDWGVWNEGRKEYALSWGGRIFCRTTDEPDHIEGMTLKSAWLDEAGQMKEQVWINIQSRLAIRQGRVIMTSTPYSNNWFYREVWKKKDTDPSIACFNWASNLNPAFTQEEYERAKASLPDAHFKRRVLGLFTQLEGVVYTDFDPYVHVVEPFDIPPEWRRFAGVDFGFAVQNAIVWLAEDPESHTYYVYREFYEKGSSLSKMANVLRQEELEYIFADAQGAQQISELQRMYGVRNIKPADKSKGSVELGIERLSKLLREERLKFFKGRTKNTVDEIEVYHRKMENPDKAFTTDGPVKKHDHLMDALRYAFSREVKSIYPEKADNYVNIKQRVRARLNRGNRDYSEWSGYMSL